MSKFTTICIVTISLLLCLAATSSADDIKEIHWGTQEWKGFTDKDGSGVYTQLFNKVFDSAGVKLKTSYMPFGRTLHLIKIGKLDFAGGVNKGLEAPKDYIIAEYPAAVFNYYAFFKKSNFPVEWEGIKTISDKKLVATPGVCTVAAGFNEKNVYVVDSRNQAIQMVLKNRADCYIDVEKLMKKFTKEHAADYDSNEFSIKMFKTSEAYMITPKTERGEKILEIYNEATRKLAQSGELKKIYDKFEMSTPVFE